MKNKIIPVFYCIPRSASTYIQEWVDQICKDKYENTSSIFVLNKNKIPILKIKTTKSGEDSFVNESFLKEARNFEGLDIFSIFILSNGIKKHKSFLRQIKNIFNIKIKKYIILRHPLEKEISFYNYWKSESSNHEKSKIKIEAKSFQKYVESNQMSDSWFMHQITKNKNLTEEDYKKACRLLDKMEVIDIQEIDERIKKIFDLKLSWGSRLIFRYPFMEM